MSGDYDNDEEDHYRSCRIDSSTTAAEVPENKPITPEEAKKLVISIELDPSDVALQVIPYVGERILRVIKEEITQMTRDIASEELHKRLELEIGAILDMEVVSEFGSKTGKTIRDDIADQVRKAVTVKSGYYEKSILDKLVQDIVEKEIRKDLEKFAKQMAAENKKILSEALLNAVKQAIPSIQLK